MAGCHDVVSSSINSTPQCSRPRIYYRTVPYPTPYRTPYRQFLGVFSNIRAYSSSSSRIGTLQQVVRVGCDSLN